MASGAGYAVPVSHKGAGGRRGAGGGLAEGQSKGPAAGIQRPKPLPAWHQLCTPPGPEGR